MESLALNAMTKLPEMSGGEVVLHTEKEAWVRTFGSEWRGTVVITTLRVLFWTSDGQVARQASVGSVRKCVVKKERFARKAVVEVWGERLLLAVRGDAVLARHCEEATREFLFSERRRRKKSEEEGFEVSGAGIGGILRRERRKRDAAGQLAAEVQNDLTALIKRAASVVELLERYGRDRDADAGLRGLGLMGGLWGHDDDAEGLARRVVAFAVEAYFPWLSEDDAPISPEKAAAAMVSLPDVYSKFNRARGAAKLVSPDDLVTALEVFCVRESPRCLADLPLELRTFSSGVKVLRPKTRAHAALVATLQALADTPGGLSDLEAARHLDIPAALARQHLLDAEAQAALCRDDAPAGLRFFPNHFHSYNNPAAADLVSF
ncbi:hypothetical protein CTAYLR_008416 [Chrysophaeum taylorii]|uniref:Vacuolar protein-sorting-associated protein 36 n=1 Tax=Chrysophaeum taylorii TaxID=2483200 RepID=A0AAD7XNF9_9STRA|nr:hypothetical protein CTAYLR_008416 [Chrysophaeum taylorii]